jgi:hypothetical protein
MSPKSRREAINQIYKASREGRPVRDSNKKVDNLLRRWEISWARRDEIFECAERDLQALAPTEGGLHIHTFLKECFELDEKKNMATKIAAYGDWTKTEPPRDRSIYRAFATCAGGPRGFDEGVYGGWELDIKPMLMDMDCLIAGVRRHNDHISVAMQLHPSIDHEGEYAHAYATLQRTKRDLDVKFKCQGKRKNSETSLECDWTELVRLVKERFGVDSKEYLLVSLWRNMPYRDDLHALVINPDDKSKGNFICIDENTATVVIHDHKTSAQWGPKKDVLDDDVRDLARRYIEAHDLVDGDYLLGEQPNSEWINKFLTKIDVKKPEHKRMHLLRHIWATSYAKKATAQYERGDITADEYDKARERLCHLMCHTPEANEKYLNPIE